MQIRKYQIPDKPISKYISVYNTDTLIQHSSIHNISVYKYKHTDTLVYKYKHTDTIVYKYKHIVQKYTNTQIYCSIQQAIKYTRVTSAFT